MKRKRFILTTVLLVCVAAVVVPKWREIWQASAYQLHTPGRPVPIDCYEKRLPWLPGPELIVADMLCTQCYLADHPEEISEPIFLPSHSNCWARYRGFSIDYPDGFRVEVEPGDWRCTCPDPSHEWNR